ncbi:sugar transferase [Nocardioides sp. LHG3406-4]|uniref:sugar transferase n=1 Tax=Nocardioides sp. LHG3406-4 TaxID=2804575 RepID=UPI003CE9A3F6
MRVLFLTQWFEPEPTFKGLQFAKELQRQGHEVEVITGYPNYPGGTVYDGYRIRAYERTVVDGVVVRRVALYPSHDSSGARRALNYCSFAATSTLAALLGRRPDVAYVYHPPGTTALPAMALRLLRGVPYVLDIQDLWPDTLQATGMVGNPRVLGVVGAFMDVAYRCSAHVVVLSAGFRQRLLAKGLDDRKLTVIPNWTYEDAIEPVDEASARRSLGLEGTFNVVFAGTMGKAQALETVLEAAHAMREDEDVRFVLVGGGIAVESLTRQAAEMGLRNLVFLPRRPTSEIGEVLAAADALLVHLKDDPLFEITIPSKIQAYLLIGKPLLMGVRGDAAAMVEAAEAGEAFAPEDPAAMVTAIRRLKALPPAERAAMGRRGSAYYERELSLAVGSARFADVLGRAASRVPYARTKRAIDVAGAASALALLAVPMAVLAALIRKRLGSPVLFRQERPGRHGKLFTILKFRTMTDQRDEDGQLLPDADRLTRFGSTLRTSSLDELPELVNVLKGDMSLVGPRPLLPRYMPYFSDAERRRFLVRPGITGLAQVTGRNLATWNERLALDTWYVDHVSPWLDLKIVGRTIKGVLTRDGAVAAPVSVMRDLDDERRAVTVERSS